MDNKRKRYKLFLDPDFHQEDVSDTTIWRWNNKTLKKKFSNPRRVVLSSSSEKDETTEQPLLDNTVCDLISDSKDDLTANFNEDLKENENNDDLAHDLELGFPSDYSPLEDFILDGNSCKENEIDSNEGFNLMLNQNNFEDEIMFSESNLTVGDIMHMIQAFALKFNLTQEARTALMKLTEIFANKQTFNFTNYSFSKKFDPPDDLITNHYYCRYCLKSVLMSKVNNKLNNMTIVCGFCKKTNEINSNVMEYFTTINLEYQLRHLLSSNNSQSDLLKNAYKKNDCDENILSDVRDGILHKKINGNKNYITLNINIDGAPIFDSSKKSMWPIQAIINELSPTQRFRKIILCGFWVTLGEPKPDVMNLFLQSFLKEIDVINNRPFKLLADGNKEINFCIVPFCFCVDTVARPILQNRIQYNGYSGCSWCLQKGIFINGIVRYPLEQNDSDLRTHEQQIIDINTSKQLPNRFINGIKGHTVLISASPFFDIVWGFPVEYMHGVLLGVTKQMWELWACVRKESFSLSIKHKKEIDERISRIKPPLDIHRLPRKMSDHKKFKASEWKSFLLYYAVPLLHGILKTSLLNHFALLVSAIYLLLKVKITENELNIAEQKLLRFVGEFEILYGEKYSTFNIHSLLHLVNSVKKSGPLWATSAFPFESEIRFFKQQVNGPKGIQLQVIKKFLQIQKFKYCKIGVSEDCRNYVNYLFYGENSDKSSDIDNEPPSNEGICINFLGKENDKGFFKKCFMNKILYYSEFCSKSENRRNNTFIEILTGEFCQIIYFFKKEDNFLMNVEILTVLEDFNVEFSIAHIHKVKRTDHCDNRVLPVSSIRNKCVCVDFDASSDYYYVCTIPNYFEVQ